MLSKISWLLSRCRARSNERFSDEWPTLGNDVEQTENANEAHSQFTIKQIQIIRKRQTHRFDWAPLISIFFRLFIKQLEIECTWMRETNVDWIFQGPACAVLLINLIFLFRIMWVCIKPIYILKSSYLFIAHTHISDESWCWRVPISHKCQYLHIHDIPPHTNNFRANIHATY